MRSLVDHGVDAIFGNPGTTENPLLISLIDHPELTYYVALHEGVAVCAAGAYAQATGRTTVANVHVAPGLGNAIGMMYGALKARVPLIVTAGQQDTRLLLREPLLSHDLVGMAAPVCKWAVQAQTPDEIGPIMAQAISVANEYPRGPVFVALPNNVMEGETDVGVRQASFAPLLQGADAQALQSLADMLVGAAAPLIIVGDDVAVCDANDALADLVAASGAVVRSDFLQARQCIAADHPNLAGAMPVDAKGIHEVIAAHDMLLMVGGPMLDEVWFDAVDPLPENIGVAQLESHPALIGQVFTPEIAAVGALADSLTTLCEAVKVIGGDGYAAAATRRNERLAEEKVRQLDSFASHVSGGQGRKPMLPAVALQALADALPAGVVIVDESITAEGMLQLALKPQGAQDFFAGRGGGIGQGIAGALGVAAAHPHQLVVAVSGDGSAMYSIQALWSAAHHDMNLLFVILANREYRVLKHNVDNHRKRFNDPSDQPYPHMDLTDPGLSFVDMAAGMGMPGRQCTTPGEVAEAVVAAHSTKGPFLLEMMVAGKAD